MSTLRFVQAGNPELEQQRVEDLAVQVVELDPGPRARTHAIHCGWYRPRQRSENGAQSALACARHSSSGLPGMWPALGVNRGLHAGHRFLVRHVLAGVAQRLSRLGAHPVGVRFGLECAAHTRRSVGPRAICFQRHGVKVGRVDVVVRDANLLQLAHQSLELARGAHCAASRGQSPVGHAEPDHHPPAFGTADHIRTANGAGFAQPGQGRMIDETCPNYRVRTMVM